MTGWLLWPQKVRVPGYRVGVFDVLTQRSQVAPATPHSDGRRPDRHMSCIARNHLVAQGWDTMPTVG